MKRILLLVLLFAVLVSGVSIAADQAGNSVTVCQAVDDSPAVNILAARTNRLSYTVWTTSGAATIYMRSNGTASAPPPTGSGNSGPLVGGQSYTEDTNVSNKALSVITKTGTAWVCAKENY